MAFPNDDYTPSQFAKNLFVKAVSDNIIFDLFMPVFLICFWPPLPASHFASMPVPEAAVYEDSDMILFKNNVGFSWQFFMV